MEIINEYFTKKNSVKLHLIQIRCTIGVHIDGVFTWVMMYTLMMYTRVQIVRRCTYQACVAGTASEVKHDKVSLHS